MNGKYVHVGSRILTILRIVSIDFIFIVGHDSFNFLGAQCVCPSLRVYLPCMHETED